MNCLGKLAQTGLMLCLHW